MAKKAKLVLLNCPRREPTSVEFQKGVVKTAVIGGGAIAGHLLAPGLGGTLIGGVVGWIIGTSTEENNTMAKIPVFYSFSYSKDVMRVQQIRNIGTIEGNAPTSPNDWEKLKRTGDKAVKNWIDQNMKYKRCIIVLIGSDTADRPWVKYEIEKAWNDGKALLGIHIHNIKCARNGTCRKGKNPFDEFKFKDGRKLSSVVPVYDPSSNNSYGEISTNISAWISHAIANKAN